MQWSPRTPLLEQTVAFSSSIRPRANISVARRWAFPSSADPLDRKPDRLTVRDGSVAKSSHSAFPRVQQCRHFKACHVTPARFQSANRVRAAQADARPSANTAFCPAAHGRRAYSRAGANARVVSATSGIHGGAKA
jgi:hypothetical protein